MIKVPPNISQIRLEAMKNLKEHVNFSVSTVCLQKPDSSHSFNLLYHQQKDEVTF